MKVIIYVVSLLPLLFVIALILLLMILRDIRAGYKLTNCKATVNPLLLTNNLKPLLKIHIGYIQIHCKNTYWVRGH